MGFLYAMESYMEKIYREKILHGEECLTERIYIWQGVTHKERVYTETIKYMENALHMKKLYTRAINREYLHTRRSYTWRNYTQRLVEQGLVLDMRLQFSSGCISCPISEAKEAAENHREALKQC